MEQCRKKYLGLLVAAALVIPLVAIGNCGAIRGAEISPGNTLGVPDTSFETGTGSSGYDAGDNDGFAAFWALGDLLWPAKRRREYGRPSPRYSGHRKQ